MQKRRNISNQTFHLKKLENKEQTKLKETWRKEIINIRVEWDEINNWKTIETINKQQLVFWKDKQNWQIFSYSDKENRKFILLESGMQGETLLATSQNKKDYKRILILYTK